MGSDRTRVVCDQTLETRIRLHLDAFEALGDMSTVIVSYNLSLWTYGRPSRSRAPELPPVRYLLRTLGPTPHGLRGLLQPSQKKSRRPC